MTCSSASVTGLGGLVAFNSELMMAVCLAKHKTKVKGGDKKKMTHQKVVVLLLLGECSNFLFWKSIVWLFLALLGCLFAFLVVVHWDGAVCGQPRMMLLRGVHVRGTKDDMATR